MTISNVTEYCKVVESTLGWVPPPGAAFRRYQAMASRVNKRLRDLDPNLYTWHNLELAVELCRREHLPRNPLGVLKHVERAVEMSVVPAPDLWQRVVGAIHDERAIGDPDGWADRLARAQGEFQREVLEEWRLARTQGCSEFTCPYHGAANRTARGVS